MLLDRHATFLHGLCVLHKFYGSFDFFGPVVNQFHYGGSREGDRLGKHSQKLDPKNQLF